MTEADLVRKYAADPHGFARDLHVPIGGRMARFANHWADFQERDSVALAPSLVAVARGDVPPIRKAWIERTKGAAKDMQLTIMITWLLLYSPRPLRIEVGAYDQRQAGEIRYIAKQILTADAPLNRLAASKIAIQQNRIVAHADTPGRAESVCEILTTDASGSHGSRPDVAIMNELSHVGSEGFAQTILDNSDKLPHSLTIICTNSGEVASWQERWRDIARDSDQWYYSVVNHPSPWISEADLAESQLRNPPERFNRLWRGIWSSGEGDGLNPADITACTTLRGPQSPQQDRVYVAGLDLGINRDHSALCILAADPRSGMVELAALWNWNPKDYGGKVDLIEVRHTIKTAHSLYGFIGCKYDFWQAELMAQELMAQELMAQELMADGVPMSETKLNAEDLSLITRSLLDAFSNRRIALYPHADLARDLLRIRIKETLRGFKLTATRDDAGHADRAMALAFCLPAALSIASKYQHHEPAPEILFA